MYKAFKMREFIKLINDSYQIIIIRKSKSSGALTENFNLFVVFIKLVESSYSNFYFNQPLYVFMIPELEFESSCRRYLSTLGIDLCGEALRAHTLILIRTTLLVALSFPGLLNVVTSRIF